MAMKDYKKDAILLRDARILTPTSTARGQQLALSVSVFEIQRPLLTVELTTKWYELFLLVKKGESSHIEDVELYKIDFGCLDDVCPPDVSPYLDHAPNPLCVKLFAERNDYKIDDLALELITGRWQIEYVDSSVMECPRCEGRGTVEVTSFRDPSKTIPNTCRSCKGKGELRPGT